MVRPRYFSSIAIGVGAYILLSRYISITGEVAESLIGALQKTGVFPQTSLDIFSLPSIGFNSTLEVLIAQMIMVLLVLSFFIASRLKLEKGMA